MKVIVQDNQIEKPSGSQEKLTKEAFSRKSRNDASMISRVFKKRKNRLRPPRDAEKE